MSNDPISAHVLENGESIFAVTINTSGHIIKGDEPVSEGGNNTGPAPYDTLLAALGECTSMTIRWYAKQQNWPLEKVEVQLTHHKENKSDYFTKTITLHGDALTEVQRSKLLGVAAKCPVQRTLEGTPIIRTLPAQ